MSAPRHLLRLALVTFVCLLPSTLMAQNAQGRGKKWVATRPITIDAQTGALRLPNDAETQELVDRLATMTSQSTDGLVETPLASGAVGLDLQDRFSAVVLARPNADGTVETRCVTSFEEAAEFLGLVDASAQQQ